MPFTYMWVTSFSYFLTRVMHSMRLKVKLLQPWVVISQSGVVESAHCDCTAGLAETCTHVGALLFKIEAVVRVREKATVSLVFRRTGYSQAASTKFYRKWDSRLTTRRLP